MKLELPGAKTKSAKPADAPRPKIFTAVVAAAALAVAAVITWSQLAHI